MGILKRLFGVKSESPEIEFSAAGESLDRERIAQMLERSPSFSFVAIPGDVASEIPAFLLTSGYEVLRTSGYSGLFTDLYAAMGYPSGTNNSIVQKAWFMAAGHTILVDPEMVLVTHTTSLSDMAATAQDTVKVAIWERVSESVALVEVGSKGIVRQSWYCEGEPSDEAINAHSEIVARPDSEGLKLALAGYGLSQEAIFGHVDATVVELQE